MATRTMTLPAAARWRFSRGSVWPYVVLICLSIAVLIPLAFLILGSFSTARLPTDFSLSQMSFINYITVWSDPQTYQLFVNTGVYVGGATVIGIAIAAMLAWFVERSDMPGKIWLYAGIPMSLAVPGLLQAMAWVLLLSPKSGFINRALQAVFDLHSAPLNVYTLGGMAFVEGLRLVPTAFLMLVPLLRSMDPSLEEAAQVAGARPSTTVRRITMGLMLPGLVAVTIYQAMTALEVFEIPGVLGMPVGIHVFATKIYAILQASDSLPVFGQANALGMMYLVLGMTAAAFYWLLIRRSSRYAVVSGKAYRPRVTALGSWKYAALGLVGLYLFLNVALPFLVMLYASFVPFLQQPSLKVFSHLTWDHYNYVFTYPKFGQTFWNTLVMVVSTATATTIFAFLISMVVVRSRFWGRRLIDQIAFMPHAIPGIVAGLAFLWLFLTLHAFGTVFSIIVGFTVTFIAYGTRAMNAAIIQVHKDLEDAASVAGAPPIKTMLRVFFPLMLPSFIGLWIWVVLLSVRIAGLPLVLYEGPKNQVLAVLIWYMWDQGEIESVGAIGVMLMASLFLLVLLLRFIGFGRGAAQSH